VTSVLEQEAAADTHEADAGEEGAKRPDRRRLRISIGLTLITMGLALVLFLAYLFAFTGLQADRRQRQLLNVFTTPAGAVPLSGALPASGAPVAVLTIPAIGLDQVVVQGTSPVELAGGPGAMPQTARLGTKGNAVIAGRHFTAGAPFADLDKLRKGDKVKVISGLGVFKYKIIRPAAEVLPGQTDPVSPTKRPQLTLLTASTLTGGGRTYVVAKLVSDPAAAKRPVHPPTAADLGVSGQSGAQASAIIWGLLLLLSLIASIVAYQRARGRLVVVYVLTTPIVLAVALMFYSQLYKLLPSMI
jgi:sortase A